MGKIYDGDVKLNVIQVCDKLRNEITHEQAKVIAPKLGGEDNNEKRKFAHAILDSYKDLPNVTPHDAEIRKLSKHLMEKHMKSTTVVEGEGSAFRLLINEITTLGL